MQQEMKNQELDVINREMELKMQRQKTERKSKNGNKIGNWK